MKRKLTLTRTSQPSILTEEEISAMVDQFLGAQVARSKDGTLTQEQVIGIAAEELRLQLENLEMAKQYRGEH
jgi:hypothetical protein